MIDAKALYEIVKGVPREAWPLGISGWNFERGYVLCRVPTMGPDPTVCDVFIWPTQAELLFEASMTQWLADKTSFAVHIQKEADDIWHAYSTYGCFTATPTGEEWGGSGHTLVQALAIACKAVKP